MGIISDVKCGRCDRRYSGLRARCPYCGARRGKRGKHANDSDNSKGKLIIGVLLILVLIVAVVILVVTSTSKTAEQPDEKPDESQQHYTGDDDVSSVQGTPGNLPPETEEPAEGEEPAADAPQEPVQEEPVQEEPVQEEPKVTAVSILCFGAPTSDFTVNVGDKVNLSYRTDPEGLGTDVEWKTSDENVFVILQTGEFTAIGSGTATLTLTVDGVTAECIVRVN